jgi:UDP-glucuronate 4-epimerase
MHFIEHIGKAIGKQPIIKLAPRHPADTLETWSNTKKLEELGYKPKTDIEVGVRAFVDWYKHFYKVN